MPLYITGFLPDKSEDSSLKYDYDINSSHEAAVMKILGWTNLDDECDGELQLTAEQVDAISSAVNEQIPKKLDIFIRVIA